LSLLTFLFPDLGVTFSFLFLSGASLNRIFSPSLSLSHLLAMGVQRLSGSWRI
jgi:hypothetical protein